MHATFSSLHDPLNFLTPAIVQFLLQTPPLLRYIRTRPYSFSFTNRIRSREGGRKSCCERPANVQGCSSRVVCSPFPPRYERLEGWIFEGRSGDLRAFVSAGRVILKFSTNAYHAAVKVTPRLTQRAVVVVVVVVKLCIRAVFALSFFPLLLFSFSFFFEPPTFATRTPFARPRVPLPGEKCARVFNFSAREHSKKIFKFHVKRCGR